MTRPVLLVTGGSRGIGAATCIMAAARGYDVAVNYQSNAKAAAEVDTHRAYMAAALEQELTRAGSHIIRSASSESMFDRFVALVSRALARTTRNRLGTAPELVGLTLAGDL